MGKVFDDFFDAQINEYLTTYFIGSVGFTYGHKSSHEDEYQFFGKVISTDDPFFSFLSSKILAVMEYPHPLRLDVIMCNAQVYGQDGAWHQDKTEMTALYFPMKWQENWGGSYCYQDSTGARHEIEYKQNRLVTHHGNIPHRGLAPSKKNKLRVSIAFRYVRAQQPAESRPIRQTLPHDSARRR